MIIWWEEVTVQIMDFDAHTTPANIHVYLYIHIYGLEFKCTKIYV